MVGPMGRQGEVGPMGPEGPQGGADPGPQGPQGEPGDVHANTVVLIPLPEEYEIEGVNGTYTFTLMNANTDRPYYEVEPGGFTMHPPHMSNPIRTGEAGWCPLTVWFAVRSDDGYKSCGYSREVMSHGVIEHIEDR